MRRRQTHEQKYGEYARYTTNQRGRRSPDVQASIRAQKLGEYQKDPDYQQRVSELKGYGIDPPALLFSSRKQGNQVIDRTRSDSYMSEQRNKALRVNQREQLRNQRQEIAQLTLQRRRRSSGRQSLLNSLPQVSSLGPSGTLA